MGDISGTSEFYTVKVTEEELQEYPCEPTLFVRSGGIIERFPLSGHQNLGRLPGKGENDIVISDPFVSREHGCFDTEGSTVTYTASAATNGIYLNGQRLVPGESAVLNDSDRLTIPTGSSAGSENDITLALALTQGELSFWDSLINAQYDALTGLPTRKLFTEWFGSVTAAGGRKDMKLFILDIDRFKQINDEYGHDCGDSALKTLAGELKTTADSVSHVCRWGGDEFVGVLRGTTEQAVTRLEAMSRRISAARIDDTFSMTISVGLCDAGSDRNMPLGELVKLADEALYRSKGAGRDRVSVYESN